MKKIHFTNLNGRDVQIMSFFDLFGESSSEVRVIDNLLIRQSILPNHCAENARIVMLALNKFYRADKVKYVEGTAISEDGEEFEHCWNLIDGKYFDVTLDVFAHNKDYAYKARRIFNKDQLQQFDHIGYPNISFRACSDETNTNMFWFNNKGCLCQRKMTQEEKEEICQSNEIIDEKVKNYIIALNML